MHEPFRLSDNLDVPAAPDVLAESLEWIRSFIRRHWAVIAVLTLPGVALGAAVLSMVPWKYQATATILLDKQRLQFFQQQSVVSDLTFETNTAIEGQLEVLKSDEIALGVIKSLQLQKDPEFAVGKPTGEAEAQHDGPITEAARERHYLDVFANLRTIRRIGSSLAIEVGFQSNNAARAAEVANAIVAAYISDIWASRRTANQNAVSWLQERLAELRRQTADAENAVLDFKAKNGIVDTGGKLIQGQQIAEISTQITQARSQLSEVSARLNRARAVVQEYETSSIKPAMLEVLNNPLTNKLLEQYLELSNREAEYSERFGADHKATQKLRLRMEEAKTGLISLMERLHQSLLSEQSILEKRVQNLEASLAATVANSRTSEHALVKLQELQSAAQSYRVLYDSFLRRHSEAVLQQEQPTTVARVISNAYQPLSRNMKKPLFYALSIAFGSMGLGVGLSLLRDLRDRTFRTSDDIERKLKSEFIGMIPTWEARPNTAIPERSVTVGSDGSGYQRVQRSKSIFWAVALSPVSHFSEGIARVKFSVFREVGMKDDGVIGFASVLPNEGASTIAAGVAQSIAKSGRSVILVDCDLRHPTLTKEFASHARCGLQEILLGHATVDDAILTDPQFGFAFLPGIVDALKARPEELLEMDALVEVVRELRRRYEFVIVDLPPLFPMLDVAMTDRVINWYVVVVQWGSSKIDTVAHAVARSRSVRERMLGFVLNKVDMRRLSLYDRRAAEYYDPKRYANYLLPAPPMR